MTESAEEVVHGNDVTHRDWDISPEMMDELVEQFTVMATCPNCDHEDYYIFTPPGET